MKELRYMPHTLKLVVGGALHDIEETYIPNIIERARNMAEHTVSHRILAKEVYCSQVIGCQPKYTIIE